MAEQRVLAISGLPVFAIVRATKLWHHPAALGVKSRSNTSMKPSDRTLIRILAPTKPGALGLSRHSLGLSCARPILTRSQAELALERPSEIREIVEADGVGDFVGQCA